MSAKSKPKSKPRQRPGRSARKTAAPSKGSKENESPNIIEEPIRVIGDRTRNKAKAAKSAKK